jgi:uncharacterized protein YoxC
MYTNRSRAKKREYTEKLEKSVQMTKEENRILMQKYMNLQSELKQKKDSQLHLMRRIFDVEESSRNWQVSSMQQNQGTMSEDQLNQ